MDACDILQLAGLGVFLVVVVARALSLRRRVHRNPVPLLSTNGGRDVPALLLVVLVNLWICEILRHILRPHVHILPSRAHAPVIALPGIRLAGAVVYVAAFAVFLAALAALGESWRLGIDARRPGRLVTHGIYAYSRHPIYLFFDLYALSTLAMNGTVILLLFAAGIMALVAWQIRREEAFLLALHGAAYRSYQRRTRRYVTWPLVGRWQPLARPSPAEPPSEPG